MTDEAPPPTPPKADDDAWIERVVGIAGNLGFNKMRLRWKLIRWQEKRRRAKRAREEQLLHVAYAHKTCGECGAVQDKDERVCTACGAKLGSRAFQMLGRLGILMPVGTSISTLLAIAILMAYARVWVAMGGGLGSPSGQLLVDFGGRWPPLMHDEPWRLLTSVFLHAGLMHLAFNLLAIATIGPRIEELYGRTATLGLFVVTGVLANVGALQVEEIGVGIGASGGLMGLIGAAAGYGQRAGRGRGFGLRNDMLKWSAYTMVFGFAVGADNWAHLFGGLTGAIFGYLVRPVTWKRRALTPIRALLGLVGVVATIGALAIILTRKPSPPEELADDFSSRQIDSTAYVIEACTRYYATGVADADTQATCASVEQLRVMCASESIDDHADTRAGRQIAAMCVEWARLFDRIPPHPPPSPQGPTR